MKNKRRILVFLLMVMCLISQTNCLKAQENELHINNVEDFLNFASDCQYDKYSKGLTVYLDSNIDLSKTNFKNIPIFNGTFSGNGHTISGLKINYESSNVGLFRYLGKEGIVNDLNVRGHISPEGSGNRVGGIIGDNNGQLLNCTFNGKVEANDYIGGLVGYNNVTGVIEDCSVQGDIQGYHYVGGIAGQNNGVINNSKNFAKVNNQVNESEIGLDDLKLSNVNNPEKISDATNIGGISGSNTGVIRNTANLSVIGYQHVGYNIGGISGSNRGYIVDCQNKGEIFGRKEVGGIVGQMEPVSNIEYRADTLQILKSQIESTNAIVNRMNQNAKANMDSMHSQMETLRNEGNDALHVITELLPSEGNHELPNKDQLIAAKNNLNSSISAMDNTLNGINNFSKDSSNTLTSDMQGLVNQLNGIGSTIANASNNIGVSIKDISDLDKPSDTTGKIDNSLNYADVNGDINVGGIAGAMAFENEFDPEDDFEFVGKRSLNVNGELRSVIVSSENSGTVSAKKKNAGGIVGNMTLGLVKNCINTGLIGGEETNFVGGIAGSGVGYIRSNYSKSILTGNNNIGGIAGVGEIITNNISITKIEEGIEQIGSIVGNVDINNENNEINNNFYLDLGYKLGAIDNIDYQGISEPLNQEEFLMIKDLPDKIANTTITFANNGSVLKQFTVPLGGKIDPKELPKITSSKDCTASWEEFENNNNNLIFDLTYEPTYKSNAKTIVSNQKANNKAVVILTGEFEGVDGFNLKMVNPKDLELNNKDSIVYAYQMPDLKGATIKEIRLLNEKVKSNNLKLFVKVDGEWKNKNFEQDGSYLKTDYLEGVEEFALIHHSFDKTPYMIVSIAVILGTTLLIVKKRKCKK